MRLVISQHSSMYKQIGGGVGAGSLSYSVSKYERRGIQANYLQCFETNVFKYTLTT